MYSTRSARINLSRFSKAEIVGKSIDPYKRPNKLGLSFVSVKNSPLDDNDIGLPSLKRALSLDVLWMISFAVNTEQYMFLKWIHVN